MRAPSARARPRPLRVRAPLPLPTQRRDAGCAQPAHIASMSAPSASPMTAEACSCASTIARWYTAATSDSHDRPRCLICAAAASPSTSR
eukprot:5936232-Pleurochrysis_carterae.AAC.1